MKECSGTAEPSPLTLISAGTASAFYVGKFSSPVWLPNHHQSALVSYSHWVGWEEGGKVPWSRGSGTVGRLHRPPVLPRLLLTELIILPIHKH